MNIRLHALLFLLILPVLCHAQEPRLFDNTQPLEITLRTDLLRLLNTRGEDPDYQPASLVIGEISGLTKTFDVAVQARGNFRRDSANCDFPPIRLNFKKKDIVDTYFEGNEKIKIVTHCKTGVPEFDQFVIREYVTYRIYNLLTPVSLNVRLASITYEDTENNLSPIERPGFLIEDIDHLAARNQMEETKEPLNLSDLDKNNALLLSLFQYMIGNTDWVLDMSKNIKTLSNGSVNYAVPYDFDYTQVVATDYTLGGGRSILTEPVRLYKGPCLKIDQIIPVTEGILEKRKEILSVIGDEKMLDYDSRIHMKQYINEFFRIINSEKQIKENILADCP